MSLTTVIVPYLDASEHVSDCLKSLINQTAPLDILVIRKKGLDPVLFDAPNITHIEANVSKEADAFNYAFTRCTSEFIGFCRASDRWAPRHLEEHLSHLTEEPDVGLSFSGADVILPDAQSDKWHHNPRLTHISAAYALKYNPLLSCSSCVARRDALEDCVVFDSDGARLVFDPALSRTSMIDFTVRLLTRTDWTIEGIAGRWVSIDLRAAEFGKASAEAMIEWKTFIKSRAPAAPAFFARHAGVARKIYAGGMGAYLESLTTSEAAPKQDIIGKTFSDAIKADFKQSAPESDDTAPAIEPAIGDLTKS